MKATLYNAAEIIVRDISEPSDHTKDTPRRFAKMLQELTTQDERDIELTTFPNKYPQDEMVVIRDIPFHSLCAHHILPFVGMAHIAYVPKESIAGLSKFARVVRYYSSALTVQEELTEDIACFLDTMLDPIGIAVIMEAEHMCMTLRGVQAHGTMTTTSSMKGCFADHSKQARTEFLSLLRS